MLELVSQRLNIPFLKAKYIFLICSLIAVVVSLMGLSTSGLNYTVDFRGGAQAQIHLTTPSSAQALSDILKAGQFSEVFVREISEMNGTDFVARIGGDEGALQQVQRRLNSALTAKMSPTTFEVVRVDVVGQQAGEPLRRTSLFALVLAAVAVSVYVALRFGPLYAPGAVLALLHDGIVILGVFVYTQREFSVLTFAAMLTMIGYSNNDTIIVFDRIRERLRFFPKISFEENVNRSLNETLSRTVLTSIATLLVVGGLYIWGGPAIHDFAFTLIVGIIVGTYSSIFIASTVSVVLRSTLKKILAKTSPGAAEVANVPRELL